MTELDFCDSSDVKCLARCGSKTEVKLLLYGLQLFFELPSRKTVHFSEQIMSADKHLKLFSPLLEAVVYTNSSIPVRENASFGRSDDVTILLFRQIIARKIWAPRKTLLLGSIVPFLGFSKSHYKPSLSNFPCVRVVNIWQRESIKSVSFWNGLRRGRRHFDGHRM